MKICSIETCEKPVKGRGWCAAHWLRWRKYGDPLGHGRVNGIDYNFKTLCSVKECSRNAHAHSFCSMHLTRWKKYGDPFFVGERNGRPLKGDVPSYGAIHRRLRRNLGTAKLYSCVDCSRQAKSWSYNNSDPNEVIDKKQGSAYSLDIKNYEPRCISCHRKFDKAGNRHRNERGQFTNGLTGKVFKDDSQVTDLNVMKRYAVPGEEPGVVIRVEEVTA